MGQKSAVYNTVTGAIIGYYDSIDSPLPETLPGGTASIDITDAEWQAGISSPYAPSVISGVYTIPTGPTLEQAKASQIALLQTSARQAEQALVSLTLASGVTTSFGMTPHDWTKIVGLYSKYVAKGAALPSGYQIPDANGTLQAVTVADIENLFNAGETQMTGAITKLASLVDQVKAATTVSAVQAIVW
jgi:hypothetical protein